MDKYLLTLKITKSQIIIAILAGLIIALMPVKILAWYDLGVVMFEDPPYSVGSITGQEGWLKVDGSDHQVATTTPYSGLQHHWAPASGRTQWKDMGDWITDGYVGFYVRTVGCTGTNTFLITLHPRSPACANYQIGINVGAGGIQFDDAIWHTATSNEWHFVGLHLNGDTLKLRYYFNGTWSDEINYTAAGTISSCGKITYRVRNNACVGGVDDIGTGLTFPYEVAPGTSVNYTLWYVYDLEPRGYYDIPQSHKYDQKFSIQWKPETKILWAWMDKARLTFRDLDNLSATSTEIEMVFDKIFHSQDGFLGTGARGYSFNIDLSGEGMASSTYLVELDFNYAHMLDWSGGWSTKKIIGYFRLPDPDTGAYTELPAWLPELPDDYFSDETSIMVNWFNSIKYNFPFGYYFLIQDILDEIEVGADDAFPETVEATFTFSGVETVVPIFGMGVIYDEYPAMFDTMKSFLTVLIWFMFGFYIYERIVHQDKLIGFNR